MTRGARSVILHYSFLLASAAFAYAVFSAPKEIKETAKETPILDIRFSDVEKLVFSEDAKIVEVEKDKSQRLTVSIFKREEEKIPDPEKWDEDEDKQEEDSAEGGEEKGELAGNTETKAYRASKLLSDNMEKSFPLMAKRNLGKLGGEKLGLFGFGNKGGTLLVKAKGQTASFEVGTKNFGSTATYLRSLSDGEVYMVSSEIVQSLDLTPFRFMERRLLEATAEDAAKLTVKTEGASRELLRKGQGKQAKWILADRQDVENEMVNNWVGAFFRLSASEYLDDAAKPKMEPVARIEVAREGADAETLELASADAEEGKKDYYAKSSYTGAWVKLARLGAETVVSDLSSVLLEE